MKFFYKNQDSGFVRTHLPCRCEERHKGCLSERADNSAYCFSCNRNFPADRAHAPYHTPRVSANQFKPPKPIQYLDTDDFARYRGDIATDSPFVATIRRTTGRNPLRWWYLGGIGNDVYFGYRDHEKRLCNIKKMRYLDDGFHRDRNANPVSLYKKADGYTMPLFGIEHLRRFRSEGGSVIALVESEKTMIYAQLTMGENLIFLAVGGVGGVTREKIEPIAPLLKGMRLLVCFDADEAGRRGLSRSVATFQEFGLTARGITTRDLIPNAPEKSDIADVIYNGGKNAGY